MNILGVRIDNFSKDEILKKIEEIFSQEKFQQIATINPEFILRAQKDVAFKNILNSCELNIADGVGIWFSFLRYGKFLKNRFTGIDLVYDILEIANKNKYGIFLVANKNGLSTWEETRDAIVKMYPQLEIHGVNVDKNILDFEIFSGDCKILFCNFGAPYQEKFIYLLKNSKKNKLRLAVGVGGSFDFLTNRIKRAPKCIRKAGLEWLWRFLQQPAHRAKRVFAATIIFPIKVLLNKFF